ncbi:methyltransferase [Micromonospora narathiwatensis]|uniref:Dimerisation domain-containing protein n=1 Tax=Micromonospora narathiwatensis TaxID=299146 RepID=A0A1A8ZSJ5_9ACTN|nr:methyltransferase [Micromonospora narathiwatensis]SBT46854.1 Dimerisation domain-containing protein [Micromonospora narathiwatensis]
MGTDRHVAMTEADYLRLLVHGTTAFELLRTALELDLFEHLEHAGGMTVRRLSEALGIEEQPARVMLLGLCALRLVDKRGAAYVNADMTRRKLLRSSPRFLGPLVDVQAKVINQALPDLAEAVRRDTNVGLRHLPGPGSTLYERLTAHPELQHVFYANMGDASRKALAPLLDSYDFSGIRHAVDVGGGDGTNAVHLARRYPHLTVTVFDQESVTRLAADRIDDPDLRRRVRFHAGDIMTEPLPEGADAVLVFHIFEIWSLERNTELLRRCRAALPDGGVCLIYNFVSNDEGTGSMSAGLVSPYFLTLASGEGMAYSAGDMERAALDAGFSHVERYEGLGFSHALVVGRR